MPVITHSFPSANGDPFNNLTVKANQLGVSIGVSTYTSSTGITNAKDQIPYLIQALTLEMEAEFDEIGDRVCKP